MSLTNRKAGAMVGLIADSLEFLKSRVLGKAWMVLLALPFVHWIRTREGVGAVAN